VLTSFLESTTHPPKRPIHASFTARHLEAMAAWRTSLPLLFTASGRIWSAARLRPEHTCAPAYPDSPVLASVVRARGTPPGRDCTW
jgi:hypothetical protein